MLNFFRFLIKFSIFTATAAFLGIGGYRVYQAKSRGGQKLSFYLIHTRLAAQGLACACLGTWVLWSLGERAWDSIKPSSDK